MKTPTGKLLLGVGVVAYVVSFFLPMLGGSGVFTPKSPSGADCALEWFLFPLIYIHLHGIRGLLTDAPFVNLAVTLSGWINPLFWLAIPSTVVQGSRGIVLRFLLVMMMPFCWVVFLDRHVYPREGYALWTIGMLLVLFSNRNLHWRAMHPLALS